MHAPGARYSEKRLRPRRIVPMNLTPEQLRDAAEALKRSFYIISGKDSDPTTWTIEVFQVELAKVGLCIAKKVCPICEGKGKIQTVAGPGGLEMWPCPACKKYDTR